MRSEPEKAAAFLDGGYSDLPARCAPDLDIARADPEKPTPALSRDGRHLLAGQGSLDLGRGPGDAEESSTILGSHLADLAPVLVDEFPFPAEHSSFLANLAFRHFGTSSQS